MGRAYKNRDARGMRVENRETPEKIRAAMDKLCSEFEAAMDAKGVCVMAFCERQDDEPKGTHAVFGRGRVNPFVIGAGVGFGLADLAKMFGPDDSPFMTGLAATPFGRKFAEYLFDLASEEPDKAHETGDKTEAAEPDTPHWLAALVRKTGVQ